MTSENPPHKTQWSQLNRAELPEMMQGWYDVKKQYPEHLLAWRMGDFYEFFYDDAKRVSQLLALTLTNRGIGDTRYPLAGIPHKATQHFKNLIKLGETIVIVEQLEDPRDVEGRIVKRGVVQVLSPGTIIDDSLLDASANNYLVSISLENKNYGIAFIDLSCGEFFCTDFQGTNSDSLTDLFSIIARFAPVECILPNVLYQNAEFVTKLKDCCSLIIKEYDFHHFQFTNALTKLLEHFNTKSLDGFGIINMEAAVCAAGAIIAFLNETQKTVLPNVTSLKKYMKEDIMFLDANTQKNLEILRNIQDGGEKGTLLSILNKTSTPMGNRLIKKIIVQPFLEKSKIEERLNIVQMFKEDTLLRNDVREVLSEIGDMERIISRINYSKTANARDLIFLKKALKTLPNLKNMLGSAENKSVNGMITSFGDYSEIVSLIESAIMDDPPVTITEGGIIRDGYDSRVDEMRNILNHGKDWILKFEEREKEKLGISAGLKVSFNRILGYFIQLTDNALKGKKLPPEYIQRSTLKGSSRYETEELKQMEIKILNADETIKDVEYELFSKVREKVAFSTKKIQEDAIIVALLDILCSLGEVAATNNYNRPKIASHQKIIIKQGRHPVIEQLNFSEPFVPNDCYMDTDKDLLLIITGPNWSGKSTYLRQISLITIMAQIGSFVPATEAEIGIVDRVFTRIGASDDLAHGQSTFMVEMNETAQILHYATQNSLVIIDELGRGTSTTDGMSIARAVLEYLHEKKIKTLFSTHFHDLITLPLPSIKNYHFLIKEEGHKLIFLRKLTEGGTDKSYGVHVAMMAGVPKGIVDRAFELVDTIYCGPNGKSNGKTADRVASEESKEKQHFSPQPQSQLQSQSQQAPKEIKKSKPLQTLLFKPESTSTQELEIVRQLKGIDTDSMTPMEALQFLEKLKDKLRNG